MYANTALSEIVRESFEVRSDIMQTMQDEMSAANRDAMNIKGFEAVARRMAKLMQTLGRAPQRANWPTCWKNLGAACPLFHKKCAVLKLGNAPRSL